MNRSVMLYEFYFTLKLTIISNPFGIAVFQLAMSDSRFVPFFVLWLQDIPTTNTPAAL